VKQLELMVTLLDQAILGIERGQVEDLLDAQFAIYGMAQGAAPIRTHVDEKIVMLCEYCLDCLCHGRREEEWAAVAMLTELRRGFAAALANGVVAREVDELVDVTV